MKKFLVLLLSVSMMCFIAVGCGNNNDSVINIYLPDGAPALALVSVFDKEEIGGQKVKFTVVPSDSIGMSLLKETPDLAIAPTNAIAKVFNKGKNYRYASAHTHGNLYIMGNESVNSLADLKGKTVGVIGLGQVPDIMFQYILTNAGVEFSTDGNENEVTLKYFNDGVSVINGLKNGNIQFGLLGEPAVTTARSQGLIEVFDIQSLWGGNGYPQAGLAVKDSVSDEFIRALFTELEKAGNFAEQNPDEAVSRIADHMFESMESTVKKLTADTVRRCNIRVVEASECSGDVIALLQAFLDIDPQSIGGPVPGESFFRFVK